MMPVDSFAGSARVKMAAAIEASPGTAVFASPVSAAAAARATRARGVSIDRVHALVISQLSGQNAVCVSLRFQKVARNFPWSVLR